MHIHVDIEKCSGHARCHALAPEIFELDDLGYNVTPDKDVAPEFAEAAQKGASACPEQAITIDGE